MSSKPNSALYSYELTTASAHTFKLFITCFITFLPIILFILNDFVDMTGAVAVNLLGDPTVGSILGTWLLITHHSLEALLLVTMSHMVRGEMPAAVCWRKKDEPKTAAVGLTVTMFTRRSASSFPTIETEGGGVRTFPTTK